MFDRIVFDIETVADETVPIEIVQEILGNLKKKSEADAVAEFGLSPLTGKICCIGYGRAETEDEPLKIKGIVSKDEKVVLNAIAELVNSSSQLTTFITFNGKNFDLPFIKIRAAINEVPINFQFTDKKYDLYPHFDVRSALTNFEQYGKGSLEVWARRFGIMTDGEATGADIQGLYNAGQFDEIANKCKGDILKTYALYQSIHTYFR